MPNAQAKRAQCWRIVRLTDKTAPRSSSGCKPRRSIWKLSSSACHSSRAASRNGPDGKCMPRNSSQSYCTRGASMLGCLGLFIASLVLPLSCVLTRRVHAVVSRSGCEAHAVTAPAVALPSRCHVPLPLGRTIGAKPDNRYRLRRRPTRNRCQTCRERGLREAPPWPPVPGDRRM
jgi:hypothetical protein